MSQLVGLSFGVRRGFVRGAFLVEADRPAETIYLLARGQVRVFRLDEEGQETVTAILGSGHLVGIAPLLGNRRHTSFAQAMTAVEGWAFPADALLARLTEDRQLLGLIAGSLAQRFALAAGLYRDVHLLPVLERVVDIEARLATCLRGDRVTLTQAALAQIVHARPETLARKRGRPRPPVPASGTGLEGARHGHTRQRVFRAGAVVLASDPPSTLIGQLTAGRLELSLVNSAGRSVELDVLEPGDLLGVSELVGMPGLGLRAVALTDGVLRLMDRATFLEEMAEHPEQLQLVSMRLAERLNRLEERLGRGVARFDERLLEFMRSQAGTISAGGYQTLPRTWSHAALGQHVGAARETVTRVLAQLEARGDIHREGRQIVLHPTRPA